jgi:hypothetical protein
MKNDLLGRAGRMISLGLRDFSVTEPRFAAYLSAIAAGARRARQLYDLLVIPGAEITQNHIRSKRNAPTVALNLAGYISADQPAQDILQDIRRQSALSIACHPHHRTTTRFEIARAISGTHRKRLAKLRGRLGGSRSGRSLCGDEPQTRSVRGEQRLPQAEAFVFMEDVAQMREELGSDR